MNATDNARSIKFVNLIKQEGRENVGNLCRVMRDAVLLEDFTLAYNF